MPKLLTNLDAGSVATITNLPTPVAAGDAVNKAYVDAIAVGLTFKEPARVASTADVNISSAPSAIDGVTLASLDRVLLKDQTTGSQNGIYVFNGTGNAMTRSTDADTSAEVKSGLYILVTEGSTQADSAWVLSTNNPITLGTTSLTFVQFSGAGQIVAGNGLSKTGNTLDVNVDGTTIQIVGDTLQLAAGMSFGSHKVIATIGDGVATSYVITHSLNTRDITVQIRDATTHEAVIANVVSTSLNTATISFAQAPASNAYVVTIIG